MNSLMDKQLFDIVILDLMIGTEDGLAIARQIRQDSDVPIIMLTAKGDEIDRIIGLEVGVDDYLAKPFNPRELLARMKSVLRRTAVCQPAPVGHETVGKVARFAGWIVNLENRQTVSPDNRKVDLTTGEFDLLVAFARNAQRVLSRDQFIDHLLHGLILDPHPGRMAVSPTPEPLGQFYHRHFAFAAQVDANHTWLALGEQHGDLHTT